MNVWMFVFDIWHIAGYTRISSGHEPCKRCLLRKLPDKLVLFGKNTICVVCPELDASVPTFGRVGEVQKHKQV
jgi:hypothetical protein